MPGPRLLRLRGCLVKPEIVLTDAGIDCCRIPSPATQRTVK